MNDHITISLLELFKLFPDAESARVYLESRIWPEGARCPVCRNTDRITTRKRAGFYRCNSCKEDFTVKTGTIFERSHVPLHKWIYSMYLLVTARKGISSLQLSKEISVTQKTAWFMLHRLRESCGKKLPKLRGTIEVDETYIGGKEGNKHEFKKLGQGRGSVGKTAVLGMHERGGKTFATPVKNVDTETILKHAFHVAEVGATLHTDEAPVYGPLGGLFYQHETVNHSEGEYVKNDVTTNSMESVFAVFKCGLNGVYHHASPKHLKRYINEFTFRLNEGNCKIHAFDRLNSFIDACVGHRLTYGDLKK